MLEDPWLSDLHALVWAKPEFSMVPIDYAPVPTRPYVGPPPTGDAQRIVFVGIPSDYGVAFLLTLLAQRANVVAVVSSSRWQRTHPKPDLFARIGGHLGRPVEVADDLNAAACARSLSLYAADLMIMASFDQILTQPLLRIPKLGWMNIHPSLLPRHRGPEPIYWTIAQGDQVSGITLHWTVSRIDAGPILAQRQVAVRPDDTAGTLTKRLVAAGTGGLEETLKRLAAGDRRTALPDLSTGTYEPPVHRPEVDWDQPYTLVDRLVRAGQPDQPPGFTYRGQRRYVLEVAHHAASDGQRPGVLKALPNGRMLAATRDALVTIAWSSSGHRHAIGPLRKQQFP